MNKFTAMIANGEISVEELASLQELSNRAQLVQKAVEACKKTLLFRLGENEINCYYYTDLAGEYEAWGKCTHDGFFTCWSNWGGDHIIGQCNLNKSEDVFQAFEREEFEHDLIRFLEEQITKAESMVE